MTIPITTTDSASHPEKPTPSAATSSPQTQEGLRADRSRRRTFTTEYKARIVAEYDAAPAGSKGQVLRREGLYDSSIKEWRQQIEAGTLGRMSKPKARARKSPEQARIAELEKEVSKLESDSARKDEVIADREAALELMGKGVAFLEALSQKDKP